jgi:hypothetical protein
MEEVERRTALDQQQLRELTPQERHDDRVRVHQLAKESEQCSVAFCNQLKTELMPALLNMSRVVTEEEDRRAWAEAAQQMEAAGERFRKFREFAARKLDELQGHDKAIRDG